MNDFVLPPKTFLKHGGGPFGKKAQLRMIKFHKEGYITYWKGEKHGWSDKCKDPLIIDSTTKCSMKLGHNF